MSRPLALRRASPRRAFALIWVVLTMVVMFGFAAFAIDMGRVHLTRTELQGASDGAARAGVWPVPQLDWAESMARSQAVIDANDAGGRAIGFDIPEQDLQFGIWWRNARIFEPMPEESWARSNAVRILTHRDSERGNAVPMFFLSAVYVNEFDVAADAVAMIRGDARGNMAGWGIFGIEYVQANGTTRTDSYDPLVAPYDPNNPGSQGGVGSNGWIEVIGTSDINGDARSGPDGPSPDYLEVWPEATVTGWQAPLDEELIFPPVEPPEVYNNQPLIDAGLLTTSGKWANGIVVNGSANVTIPGGTPENPNIYYISTLQLNSNTVVAIDGAVEFYVYGPVDLTGSIDVLSDDGAWPLPSNLKIFVIGEGPVEIGGGSALHAQIYCPEAPVTIHGTSGEFGLFGSVIGKSIDILGNSAIHYDGSRFPGQPEPLPPWVELVH